MNIFKVTAVAVFSILVAATGVVPAANAETKALRIGRQIGLGYLQLYVMQEQKLIEKYAKEEGIGDLVVTYTAIGSPATLNDGILSGNLDLASAGPPPFLNFWDRTKGGINVKMLTALNMQPMRLNTNKPEIRSIKDFTTADRIAVPGVKTSMHAVLLGMAAEKYLGADKRTFFDPLQVPFNHPDAVIALLSGQSVISGHFATIPFQSIELKDPGIHTVVTSYDLTDGPSTVTLIWAASKFHDENPKTMRATMKALDEATKFINEHRAEAAKIFIKVENSKMSQAEVEAILADPDVIFSLTPQKLMKFADFMHRAGLIKNKPASWKDLVFVDIQELPGS